VVLALLFAGPPVAAGEERPLAKSGSAGQQNSTQQPSTVASQLAEMKKLLEAQAQFIQEQAKLIEELRTRLNEQGHAIASLQQQVETTRAAATPTSAPIEPTGQPQEASAPAAPPTEQAQAQPSAEPPQQEAPATKLPEWLGRTTFSGTAYFRYSRELQRGAKDFNQFEFDRIYFIFRSQLTDRVSLRYTMEGARRDPEGDFDIATKHFFIEVAKFPFDSSRVVAGLADLPWVPYEEGVWGYRFQGTVFPDREGYLTSTDLGASWKVDLPDKRGDLHLSFVNGEGWTKPEGGKYKDVHLRFTLSPFRSGWAKGIFLGAFGSLGNYDGVPLGLPNDRRRAILQGGYRGKHLRFMGSYLWASDPVTQLLSRHPSLVARAGQLAQARGLSVFTVVNLGMFSDAGEKWELIARYDRLDPDRLLPDNEHQRWIFGPSYRWNRYVQTLLDFEQVLVDAGSLRPMERRLMLQNEIRF
jgi:hypothetical protein